MGSLTLNMTQQTFLISRLSKNTSKSPEIWSVQRIWRHRSNHFGGATCCPLFRASCVPRVSETSLATSTILHWKYISRVLSCMRRIIKCWPTPPQTGMLYILIYIVVIWRGLVAQAWRPATQRRVIIFATPFKIAGTYWISEQFSMPITCNKSAL